MASLLWNVLGSSEIIQGHSSLERTARSMVWLELNCLLEPKLHLYFFRGGKKSVCMSERLVQKCSKVSAEVPHEEDKRMY